MSTPVPITLFTPNNIFKHKQFIADNEPLPNSDQVGVYNFVLGNIFTRICEIIFLNTLGGTGKTYLLIRLAKMRHNSDLLLLLLHQE